MAYADIGAKSNGDTLDETYANQIRANFIAGVPDIMASKGDLAVGTASDAASRLAVGAASAILVPDSSTATGLAWQIAPTCRLYNSTAFEVAEGDWRTVTWDSESYDSDSLHSTTTNTERIVIPTGGAGLYLFGGVARFGTSGYSPVDTGHNFGFLLLQNAAVVAADFRSELKADIFGGSEDVYVTFGPWLVSAAATDYFYLSTRSKYTLDLTAATTNFWCIFQRRAV
jgi:hypothetical protein